MTQYTAYVFTGQDPVIKDIKALATRGSVSAKDIEERGGPAASTVRNWLSGKTKRPQNATIEAAGRAMGFERQWVTMDRGERKGGKKR